MPEAAGLTLEFQKAGITMRHDVRFDVETLRRPCVPVDPDEARHAVLGSLLFQCFRELRELPKHKNECVLLAKGVGFFYDMFALHYVRPSRLSKTSKGNPVDLIMANARLVEQSAPRAFLEYDPYDNLRKWTVMRFTLIRVAYVTLRDGRLIETSSTFRGQVAAAIQHAMELSHGVVLEDRVDPMIQEWDPAGRGAPGKKAPGPNTLCPCGSKRKYKRCHEGLPRTKRAT